MAEKATNVNAKQRLHETVMSSQDISELLPMLNSLISLDTIKNLLHAEIELVEELAAPKIYFNSSPMNHIFCDDIIQFILSFAGFYAPRGVSKKWNNYCIKNENTYILNAHKVINDKPTEIEFNKETNNTYIVHRNVKKLHPLYKKWGYKGPCILQDPGIVFDHLESGDRLLICGTNDATFVFGDIRIRKNVQIIGMGSNAIIKYSGRDMTTFLKIIQADVYVENITFDFRESFFSEACITVCQQSNLTLNNVKILIPTFGILVHKMANLNATDCEFIGGSSCIDISLLANEININKCLFKKCGKKNKCAKDAENGCIVISDFEDMEMMTDDDRSDQDDEFVKINCVGNVFEDNMCYPICQQHPGRLGLVHEMFVPIDSKLINATDNLLKGFNQIKIQNEERLIDDANVLYFNDQLDTFP